MVSTYAAQAGTLESNDIAVRISPNSEGNGNAVQLESIVIQQFGEAIRATINDCLAAAGLSAVRVEANDRGALECTIKARMEAAIARYKEARS